MVYSDRCTMTQVKTLMGIFFVVVCLPIHRRLLSPSLVFTLFTDLLLLWEKAFSLFTELNIVVSSVVCVYVRVYYFF